MGSEMCIRDRVDDEPRSPVRTVPVCCTPEPVTPGGRSAVRLGKLRTPGRRELKAILSDSVALNAVETLRVRTS